MNGHRLNTLLADTLLADTTGRRQSTGSIGMGPLVGLGVGVGVGSGVGAGMDADGGTRVLQVLYIACPILDLRSK